MPRASLSQPELVPEVELHLGFERRVSRAGRGDTSGLPLAVAEDPKLVEFEVDPETGDWFAIGLKPGRTLIRHPRDEGDMATKVRIEPPELLFPGRNDIPRYLRGHCNPATFALAVNHYVRMGEARACRHLVQVSELGKTDEKRFGSVGLDWQISEVARVLFWEKGSEPLRGAYLGATMLPYQSMPDESWPLLPMAEQDGVYFNLSGPLSIIAGGPPEPASSYLRYCRKEGTFRRTPLKVPTRQEAIAAREALLTSERWRSAREQAARKGEAFSEGWHEFQLLTQARSIYPLPSSK